MHFFNKCKLLNFFNLLLLLVLLFLFFFFQAEDGIRDHCVTGVQTCALPISFNEFVIHLTPVIILVMIAQAIMIHLVWGKELRTTAEREARVMAMNPADCIEDWLLLKQSLVVISIVMIAFVFARPLNLEPATIGMFGAAVLMLLDNWAHVSEKASH